MQEWITGILVFGAVVFLVRRTLKKRKKSDADCDSCS
ncbi:MAG: FeoB-associated Cys-rich membrane protein [Bacteroidota bacterium]